METLMSILVGLLFAIGIYLILTKGFIKNHIRDLDYQSWCQFAHYHDGRAKKGGSSAIR